MLKGKVIKGIGGLYNVKTDNGIYACRARGKFRKDKISPLPGDNVTIEVISDTNEEGLIVDILERKNKLIRPPIANIDIMFIVIAVKNPEPSLIVTDKLIAVCEEKQIEPVICINKIDLKEDEELYNIYRNAGFKTLCMSAKENIGIDELKKLIKNNVCAFSGFSGVGKTSILNQLGLRGLQVGEISSKILRGRHTTRHVELFEVCGGYIADTPGFGDLDIEMVLESPKENLQYLFREFDGFIGNCRFNNCCHINEPSCAVKEALNNNLISISRYESYKCLYNEYINKKQQWD